MRCLAVAELAVLDYLLRIQQSALPGLCELLQPVQCTRRNPPADRHRDIDRHAAPLRLVEQHHDLGIARLHPLGQRAVVHAPAADELLAGIDRAVGVIVAAGTGAVMAGLAGIDRFAFDNDLQPAVAAGGAGLAFTRFLFAQSVVP